MFQNYMAVALRNLIGHKLYSAINIIGLAIGLAACIVIALFVRDELSYDKHWSKADSIYRLNLTFELPGREPMTIVQAPGPAKVAMEKYFSQEVANVTRLNNMFPVVRYQDKVVTENIFWTDAETADVFDLNVVAGDIRAALGDKASLAINQSFAKRYFGNEDPINKVLTISNYDIVRDYRIAAVFEDMPHNTVLDIQALAQIDEADFVDYGYEFAEWFSANNYIYFELKDGANIETLTERFSAFLDDSIEIPAGLGPFDKASEFMSLSAQKLTDIQLNPVGPTGSEMKPTGSMANVVIFVSIAVLILVIACINFMNLATAKATQRAREVALRKVMGADRSQLIVQFLGESILLAVVGLTLGVVIVELVIGAFGNFVGKELTLNYSDGLVVTLFVGLSAFVGILGGIYPALILSGFLPARVLKANKSAETSGSAQLRSALVIIQFAISIGLIVATSAIFGQRLYATSMDPGFNKDNLMLVWNLGRAEARDQQDTFRQRVISLPGVKSAAYSADTPSSGNDSNSSVVREGDDPSQTMLIGRHIVDYEFFDTYQTTLVEGRVYSKERKTDGTPRAEVLADNQAASGTAVINEAAVRRLGYLSANDAIGKRFSLGVGADQDAMMEIIGVIKDMQFQSLRSNVRPEMYLLERSQFSSLTVRYDGNPSALTSQMEKIWRSMFPSIPFATAFVDDRMAAEFEQENQQSYILAVFAGLAIVIACLGLYGLASFTAERRTKEIGIRKVMGATVLDIVRLLLWQFSKPVLIANLIAWPIVAYGIMNWLERFPYRLELWWIGLFCVGAGAIALAIAWLTVGSNAAKVARSNPIKALRYE